MEIIAVQQDQNLPVTHVPHMDQADHPPGLHPWAAGAVYSIVTLLFALMPAKLVAQDEMLSSCYAIDLSRSLYLVTSGAWTPEGTIIAPDQHSRELLEMASDGTVISRLAGSVKVSGSSGKQLPLIQPSKIRRINDGYLLEDEKEPRGIGNDEIFRLDENLQIENRIENRITIKGRALGEAGILDVVYDWSPIDSEGAHLLAFGDIRGSKGWYSAFLMLQKGSSEIVYAVRDLDDPAIELYLRTSSYITSLDGKGYILFMENNARIGEVAPGEPGVRSLLSFPVEFSRTVVLYRNPSLKGEAHRQATAQYEQIQNAKTPMGIYGWRKHLYLLAKEKINTRLETTWRIIKLDPDSGKTLDHFTLPTTAAHVTIIPNESGNSWAVIEKGPVRGVGPRHAPYMHTASMVLFPGKWLEDDNESPLGVDSAPPECLDIN